MVIGIGIDVVDVARVRSELRRDASAFKRDLFTPHEIGYCEAQRSAARHYAARLAAKEALYKALETGIEDGGAWRDVEVRRGPSGGATIALRGRAKEVADHLGARRVLVSLSHTDRWAVASVVAES